jgi:hypothetical protein
MKTKKIIKKIGLKKYIIYQFLRYSEILINTPYIILKSIITILYCIFDFLNDLFCKDEIILLSNISKKIDKFKESVWEMISKG